MDGDPLLANILLCTTNMKSFYLFESGNTTHYRILRTKTEAIFDFHGS